MHPEKRKPWREQIDRLRSATPDERLRAASAQRKIELELLKSGLRARFPSLSDAELQDRMGEIIFGKSTWQEMCDRRRRFSASPRSL